MNEAEKLSFRKIQAVLVRRTDNAILVELAPSFRRVWIPRVCLSVLTDRLAEDLPQMSEFEMQLVEWKAEELNL